MLRNAQVVLLTRCDTPSYLSPHILPPRLMAIEYTIDELDRITATLEHLNDAIQDYYDHQQTWTPVATNRLLASLRTAGAQIEGVELERANRIVRHGRTFPVSTQVE